MTTANHHTRRANRIGTEGFTLIEVILAVSLSTILMGMLASAVFLNVRVLQRQQTSIERSQIARNVLMMIKSDIRAALQYKPADVTGLDALSISQEAIAGLAGGMDLSGLDMSGLSNPDAGTSEPEPTGATQNISGGQNSVLRPGLYGNQTELMVDVSRLPRVDQYDPIAVGGNSAATSLPSDVKTVSYFVSEMSLESNPMVVGVDDAQTGGLYRRQLDRAVAAYSADIAGALAVLGNTEMVSSEIVAIEFRYFDGTEWVTEWDSDVEGGFPAAVEIMVLVDNERPASLSMATPSESAQQYRSVVNLPVAEILADEESGDGSTTGGGR